MNRQLLLSLLVVGITCGLCGTAGAAEKRAQVDAPTNTGVSSMIIRITNNTIESLDASGQVVKSGKAGTDDAMIIQNAIDRLKETMGGQVLLRAGKYRVPVEFR